MDIVPPTFSGLIPAEPISIYKYGDESSCEFLWIFDAFISHSSSNEINKEQEAEQLSAALLIWEQ